MLTIDIKVPEAVSSASFIPIPLVFSIIESYKSNARTFSPTSSRKKSHAVGGTVSPAAGRYRDRSRDTRHPRDLTSDGVIDFSGFFTHKTTSMASNLIAKGTQ